MKINNVNIKIIHNFFDELYEIFYSCLEEKMPNLKKEQLEENGKIYYMNDKDDTIFNYTINKHLCHFMSFYNSSLGAVKITVYFDGKVVICLYNDGDNKPFEIINKKTSKNNLLNIAFMLYNSTDKKKIYNPAIDDITFDDITEEDRKSFYEYCDIEYLDNDTALTYVNELKNKYIECNREEEWNNFKSNRVELNELDNLKIKYPKIPMSLISLLKYSNGSSICFLGDYDKNKYYLLSSKEILDSTSYQVDSNINENEEENINWIHFASSINDENKIQLFIDFTSSESGVKGQVIKYSNNNFEVIANSFDEYLNKLVKNKMNFIGNDEVTNIEIIKENKEINNSIKINLFSFAVISIINVIALSIITPKENYSLYLFVVLLTILNFILSIIGLIKLSKNKISNNLINLIAIFNMIIGIIYISLKEFNYIHLIILLLIYVFGIWTISIVNKRN